MPEHLPTCRTMADLCDVDCPVLREEQDTQEIQAYPAEDDSYFVVGYEPEEDPENGISFGPNQAMAVYTELGKWLRKLGRIE